jgi:hypothetical protein
MRNTLPPLASNDLFGVRSKTLRTKRESKFGCLLGNHFKQEVLSQTFNEAGFFGPGIKVIYSFLAPVENNQPSFVDSIYRVFPGVNRSVTFDFNRLLHWESICTPNGRVDRATALASSLAGSRLMRKALTVAPVQRFVGRRPVTVHFFRRRIFSIAC